MCLIARSKHIGAALAAATIWFNVIPARADEPSDTASTLFRKGREAMRVSDFTVACLNFSESQKLHPSLGTVLNLALCEEKLERLTSALGHLHSFLAAAAPDDERRSFAEEKATDIEHRTPRLTIRLDGAADAHVLLDGVQLEGSLFGAPLPIDPGAHTLVLRRPEQADEQLHVDLREGENIERRLEIPTRATAPDTSKPGQAVETRTPTSRDPPAPTSRLPAYLVGAVGIAGLTASLVAGAIILGKKKSSTTTAPPARAMMKDTVPWRRAACSERSGPSPLPQGLRALGLAGTCCTKRSAIRAPPRRVARFPIGKRASFFAVGFERCPCAPSAWTARST